MFDFANFVQGPAHATETALFLSSPFGATREWAGLADCLGPRVECRAYAHPGPFVHDAGLAETPVHLVAHGSAGYHALTTAIQDPYVVQGITLIDPDLICALHELAPCHQFRGHMRMIQKATDLTENGQLSGAAQAVTDWWVGRRAWSRTSARLQERFAAAMPALVADWDAQLDAPLALLDVVTLDCPVHLITGRRVRSDVRALSGLLRLAFPNCTLSTVRNARGAAHLSDPHIVGPMLRNGIVSRRAPCQATPRELAA